MIVDLPHSKTIPELEPVGCHTLVKLREGGEEWVGVLVVNENKRQVWLPIITTTDNKAEIEMLLKNIGCTETGASDFLSPEIREKIDTALNYFPPVVALNFVSSPAFSNVNLKMVDPPPSPTPVIAPDAPPQSGKTIVLSAVKITNPEVVEVVDLDPHTNQSLSATLESLVTELSQNGIDPRKRLTRLATTAINVYFKNKSLPSPTIPSLGDLLDQLTSDYLNNNFYQDRIAVLADVSGYLPTTQRWSPSRALCKILPSISLFSGHREGESLKLVENPAKRSALILRLNWMYDRIATNLGNRPNIAGNEDQQSLALNLAKDHQVRWKSLFT